MSKDSEKNEEDEVHTSRLSRVWRKVRNMIPEFGYDSIQGVLLCDGIEYEMQLSHWSSDK
jgi:hypothetical protein